MANKTNDFLEDLAKDILPSKKRKKKIKEKEDVQSLLDSLPGKKSPQKFKKMKKKNQWYSLNNSTIKKERKPKRAASRSSKLVVAESEEESFPFYDEDESDNNKDASDNNKDASEANKIKELNEALDDIEEGTCKAKARTWTSRAEKCELNWEESRQEIFESVIARNNSPEVCQYCYTSEASIFCFDCEKHYMCFDCDKECHSLNVFHDRSWFEDFWMQLSPLQSVVNSNVVIVEKVLPITSHCLCNHQKCNSCKLLTSQELVSVITTKGRFNLNKSSFSCCNCGLITDPFNLNSLIKSGYWPNVASNITFIVKEDCLQLWDRYSKRSPGTSLSSFLKSLEDISIMNERNGKINHTVFSSIFKEWRIVQYKLQALSCSSPFDCPGCFTTQHSCHVDGNCKLYRYKSSGKRTGKSFYDDIFIAKKEDVELHLKELGYNHRQSGSSKEAVYCGSSFLKAAQDKSKRKAALDETGFEYCVCRHGFAQKGVNMYRGEIFGYASYLQTTFMTQKKVKFLWYDVICQYWVWLKARNPFLADQMSPALSVMHGKMHNLSCQLEYGGRWQSGSALTSGEEAEQVNSYLSRISNTTKYMLSENRNDTITEFAMEWNLRKLKKLAFTLAQRYVKVCKELSKSASACIQDEEETNLCAEIKLSLKKRSQEKFTKKELCCTMHIKLQQLGAVTAEDKFRTLNIDHLKKFSDSTPILLKKYESLKKNILETDCKFSFEDVRPMILERLANFLVSTISAKRFDIRHKAMSIKKLADTSKQRIRLRRTMNKESKRVEVLVSELNSLGGEYKKMLENSQKENEINERRKVAIDESMNRKRLAEEKDVLLEEMKSYIVFYRTSIKKNQEAIDALYAEETNGICDHNKKLICHCKRNILRKKLYIYKEELSNAKFLFGKVLNFGKEKEGDLLEELRDETFGYSEEEDAYDEDEDEDDYDEDEQDADEEEQNENEEGKDENEEGNYYDEDDDLSNGYSDGDDDKMIIAN